MPGQLWNRIVRIEESRSGSMRLSIKHSSAEEPVAPVTPTNRVVSSTACRTLVSADGERGLARATAVSQAILRRRPPGVQPPIVRRFAADSVPIVQMSLSSE